MLTHGIAYFKQNQWENNHIHLHLGTKQFSRLATFLGVVTLTAIYALTFSVLLYIRHRLASHNSRAAENIYVACTYPAFYHDHSFLVIRKFVPPLAMVDQTVQKSFQLHVDVVIMDSEYHRLAHAPPQLRLVSAALSTRRL